MAIARLHQRWSLPGGTTGTCCSASAVMWAAGACLLCDVIVLIGQGSVGSILQLLLVLRLLHCVDDHLRRLQRHLLHKVQVGVPAPTHQASQ